MKLFWKHNKQKMEDDNKNEENEQRPLDILKHFIFDKTEYHVDITWEKGEPLFKASDIGKVIGVKEIRSVVRDYDADEVHVRTMHMNGVSREHLMLTESGIYRLLFQSRKPVAKPFRKWVTEVIKDIQRNGRYEIKTLIEKLDESKKKIDVTQSALLKAYHNKEVVYFGRIGERDGKMLIKIGQTKDIWTSFTERHTTDYGQIELIQAFECQLNEQFEYFLLHHQDIRKHLFKETVKLNGGKSNEVILVNNDELKKVFGIVKTNLRNFQTISDVQFDLKTLIEKIDQKMLKDEIDLKMVTDKIDQMQKDYTTGLETLREEFQLKQEKLEAIEKEEPIDKTKPQRRRVKGTGQCLGCEIKITNRAQFCTDCANDVQPKKFEITKEELHDFVNVQKIPFTKLGKKFGVSDNAIRKRCRTLGVDVRRR